MTMTRRTFAATGVAAVLASTTGPAQAAPRVKAIAFDAFPIFDPRPAFKLVAQTFPEGDALRAAWFGKVFGYSWLLTSAGQYMPFTDVMRRALRMTCAERGVDLDPADEDRIIEALHNLPVWPDVPAALDALTAGGIRLAFLPNMTEEMLRANMAVSSIERHFEHVLSTDLARAFKPAAAAYQLGPDAFGLPKEEIGFAAFAGWDVTGASWFGFPVHWVNRTGAAPETLEYLDVSVGPGMEALVSGWTK